MLLFSSCKKDDDDDKDGSIVANAGADITAFTGQQVVLDGSNSGALVGVPSYLWEFTAKPVGSTALLQNPGSLAPSFIPDLEGIYEVRLTVSVGNLQAADAVRVTASRPPEASVTVSNNISSDVVWTDHVSDPLIPDYIITAEVSVNARLTIEPNVFIQVKEGIGIRVTPEGTIISSGTPGNEVIMTSSSPGEGLYWKGLLVNSNSNLNKLEHTHVLYAGNSVFSGSGSNVASAVKVYNGKLSLINTKIANSLNYGLVLQAGELNEFSLNTFENIEMYAIALSADQAGKLDNASSFANPSRAVEIYASTIESNRDIIIPDLPANARYYVNGNLILKSYFEISAGAYLDFAMNAYVLVDPLGTLVANGTESDPIVFTSSRAGEGIYWKGFHIKSSDPRNSFNHAVISHAGSSTWNFPGLDYAAAIGIENGALKLTNTTISNSNDYGVYIHSGTLTEFDSNNFSENKGHALSMMADQVYNMDGNTTFSNNGWDGVSVYKSTLTKESIWAKLNGNASYRVLEAVLLDAGLTLAPGLKVAFDEAVYFKVQNSGYFSAIGNASEPIVMTTSNIEAGRYWGGIWFRTKDARNVLDFVELSYAGGFLFNFAGPDFAAAIAADNSDEPIVSITNSIIQQSKSYAIYWEGGTINDVLAPEAGNTFSNNGETPDVVINP
ncbi:MAG: right-handed parallel beta-helix repeat-containing protein [Bacteroidales bacterium]|nr:right-handed parallel beta-helix repeat-containing protein [Bacteroidales bacterium]